MKTVILSQQQAVSRSAVGYIHDVDVVDITGTGQRFAQALHEIICNNPAITVKHTPQQEDIVLFVIDAMGRANRQHGSPYASSGVKMVCVLNEYDGGETDV